MSIFEWLFEKDNPHPTGDIKNREKPDDNQPTPWVAIFIGQLLFWFIVSNKIANFDSSWSEAYVAACIQALIFFAYIKIGYSLDFQPDYDNTGWFGVFDNPFRFTDDINRWLFFFRFIFYPGYLMGLSFVHLWLFLKSLRDE